MNTESAKVFKRLFLLLVILNFLNYFDRYIVTSVLDPIGRDLGLNDTQLGSLASAFLIVYMCAAPLFGFLADKWSRTKLVAIGVMLWSLATSATAFAGSFESLFALRALVGVGEAAYAGIGPAILSDLYAPEKRNRPFMFYYLAIPVGSALGFGFGGWLASITGWRTSFMVAGIPGILLALVMFFQTDPHPQPSELQNAANRVRLPIKEMLRLIVTNRVWLVCTVSYTGYTFAMGALTHWLPTLFQRQHGLTTGQSGILFGGLAVLAGVIGTFAGGLLTEKYQKQFPFVGLYLSIATLALAVPALGLVFYNAGNLVLAAAWLGLALVLLFVNTTPMNVVLVSSLPTAVRATGTSLNVFFIHLLGDAVSPAIVGHLSDKMGSTAESLMKALLITLPPLFIGALVLFLAKKRQA